MGTTNSATTSGEGVASSSGELVDTDNEPVDTDCEPRSRLTGVVVAHRPETSRLAPIVLDWLRIDAEENFETVRLTAPDQQVTGRGFAWEDWYASVAVDDVEVGERSLYLNSLSAPLESAPTAYFDQLLQVETHPNGTMAVGLRIGDVAPFRSAVRVAQAAPLGSLSKSPPESTLLFEVDGVITGLQISPSGEVLYFQVSGSWWA